MGGWSFDSRLTLSEGLSVGERLTVGTGLPFEGFGGGPTPPGNDGILLENGTDFLMQEDGTSFLLQE
jgi:hypothetical protein